MNDPEPSEARSKAREFLAGLVGAAKNESVRVEDEIIEAEKPWWKRRPKRAESTAYKTDPTPRERYARRNAKRHIDPDQTICACRGCACVRLTARGATVCTRCEHGSHARARTFRRRRQAAGHPTPAENIRRRIAKRKEAARV